MFESIPMAPPDPILGLTEAFVRDPNPAKINLGVGVYKDRDGRTPVLACVRQAQERLLREEQSKSYKPIAGDPAFAGVVQPLLFGAGHEILTHQRAATAHTPGGTGALRVAGDYLHKMHPGASLWLSDPTWANHANIFTAAGVPLKRYPYFDAPSNGLAFEPMLDALSKAPAGDVILLHGCCHNPSGIDLGSEQWSRLADLLAERGLLPLVDFAYQGFAGGIEDDATGLLALCRPGGEALICSSFSKNFGLYNERVGALTLVAGSGDQARAVLSHAKAIIRANYSNPPAHGGAIVTTVLNDPALRSLWEDEVGQMRDRVNGMRDLLVRTLADKGAGRDYSFISRQKGMFSFSGLNKDQVRVLKEKHAIYIVGSGRINVAGITESNVDRLCDAWVGVL